jgi:decaprenyl-phosphate phosphoribosyltransferase
MSATGDCPTSLSDKLTEFARLLRVQQWVKNLFIFLPLFFSLRITEIEHLSQAALAFAAFCLVSSAVYIFNDLRDIDADRLHPKKKMRPLASGSVPKGFAVKIMVALGSAGLALSWSLGQAMLQLTVLYLFLNIAYSLKLKHVPLVDIFIVAMGFVIRIFVGGVVTDTKIYIWIVIMTFLLALFLALAKRRSDVILYRETNAKMRDVIDAYNLIFIDSAMMIMAAVVIVSYIMYTVSPDVVAKFGTDKLYLTTVFVVLGVLRYMQITFVENNSGSPTEILFTDRFIQFCLGGWLFAFALLIYHFS